MSGGGMFGRSNRQAPVEQRASQPNPMFSAMQGNLFNQFQPQSANPYQEMFRQLIAQPDMNQSMFPTMMTPYDPRRTVPGGLMGSPPVVQPDLTDFNSLFDDRIKQYIPENAMPGYTGE